MTERLVAAVHNRVEVLGLAASARALATSQGFDPKHAQELSLVIAELGMNALLHGGGGLVQISLSLDGWTVEAEDSGRGFSPAVLADAGQSDHLGAAGVRPPGDGKHNFGSGLASVRRMSTRLELSNRRNGGARAVSHRDLSPSAAHKGATT
jgi:anti-sigma regulatory factor (Ser/Thr protein kinase)